jgi:hypothetical protein
MDEIEGLDCFIPVAFFMLSSCDEDSFTMTSQWMNDNRETIARQAGKDFLCAIIGLQRIIFAGVDEISITEEQGKAFDASLERLNGLARLAMGTDDFEAIQPVAKEADTAPGSEFFMVIIEKMFKSCANPTLIEITMPRLKELAPLPEASKFMGMLSAVLMQMLLKGYKGVRVKHQPADQKIIVNGIDNIRQLVAAAKGTTEQKPIEKIGADQHLDFDL